MSHKNSVKGFFNKTRRTQRGGASMQVKVCIVFQGPKFYDVTIENSDSTTDNVARHKAIVTDLLNKIKTIIVAPNESSLVNDYFVTVMCDNYEKEIFKTIQEDELKFKTNFNNFNSTSEDSYYCAAQIIKNNSVIFVRKQNSATTFERLLPISIHALIEDNKTYSNKVTESVFLKNCQMRRTRGDGACYYHSSIGAILETIFWKNQEVTEFDGFVQKIIDKLKELQTILNDASSTHKIKDFYTSLHIETIDPPENYYDIAAILKSIVDFKTQFDKYYSNFGKINGAMPFLFNVEMNKTINYNNKTGLVKNFVKAFKLLISKMIIDAPNIEVYQTEIQEQIRVAETNLYSIFGRIAIKQISNRTTDAHNFNEVKTYANLSPQNKKIVTDSNEYKTMENAIYSNGIAILDSTDATKITSFSNIFTDEMDYNNIKRYLAPIRHICELWHGITDEKKRSKITEYIADSGNPNDLAQNPNKLKLIYTSIDKPEGFNVSNKSFTEFKTWLNTNIYNKIQNIILQYGNDVDETTVQDNYITKCIGYEKLINPITMDFNETSFGQSAFLASNTVNEKIPIFKAPGHYNMFIYNNTQIVKYNYLDIIKTYTNLYSSSSSSSSSILTTEEITAEITAETTHLKKIAESINKFISTKYKNLDANELKKYLQEEYLETLLNKLLNDHLEDLSSDRFLNKMIDILIVAIKLYNTGAIDKIKTYLELITTDDKNKTNLKQIFKKLSDEDASMYYGIYYYYKNILKNVLDDKYNINVVSFISTLEDYSSSSSSSPSSSSSSSSSSPSSSSLSPDDKITQEYIDAIIASIESNIKNQNVPDQKKFKIEALNLILNECAIESNVNMFKYIRTQNSDVNLTEAQWRNLLELATQKKIKEDVIIELFNAADSNKSSVPTSVQSGIPTSVQSVIPTGLIKIDYETSDFALEKITSSKFTYKFSEKGIANAGNTCYFNSVIQCLIHTEPFINFLHNYKPTTTTTPTSIFEIFKSFYGYIISLDATQTSVESNDKNHIYKTLVNLKPRQENIVTPFLKRLVNQQQDAPEFLNYLFSSMIESEICNDKNVITESCMDFYKLFSTIVSSTLTCVKCGYKSISREFELTSHVGIDSTDNIVINQSIKNYLVNEMMGDSECSNCLVKSDNNKKIDYVKFPSVLVILMKKWNDTTRKAIYPIFYIKQNSKLTISENVYNLCATCNQSGNKDGGHYAAWVKNENYWSEFNDSTYKKTVTLNKNNQKHPYLLFYQKDSITSDNQIDYNDIFIQSVKNNVKNVSDKFIDDVYLKMTKFDKDSFGRTPLFYAAESSMRDNSQIILKLIDKKNCNMYEKDKINGETPLQIAMKNATEHSFMNIVCMMNHESYDVSKIDSTTTTPKIDSLTVLFNRLRNTVKESILSHLNDNVKQYFSNVIPRTGASSLKTVAGTTTSTIAGAITSTNVVANSLINPGANPVAITGTNPPGVNQCPIIITFGPNNSISTCKIITDANQCTANITQFTDSSPKTDKSQYITWVTIVSNDKFVSNVDLFNDYKSNCGTATKISDIIPQ